MMHKTDCITTGSDTNSQNPQQMKHTWTAETFFDLNLQTIIRTNETIYNLHTSLTSSVSTRSFLGRSFSKGRLSRTEHRPPRPS
jgi:hypothetical protein